MRDLRVGSRITPRSQPARGTPHTKFVVEIGPPVRAQNGGLADRRRLLARRPSFALVGPLGAMSAGIRAVQSTDPHQSRLGLGSRTGENFAPDRDPQWSSPTHCRRYAVILVRRFRYR